MEEALIVGSLLFPTAKYINGMHSIMTHFKDTQFNVKTKVAD